MHIRPEREAEYSLLYDFVKEAFSTAPHVDGDEQDYVNKLRASEQYLPELALVAEENGNIIGHIMFTTMKIKGEKACFTALLLSPLSVALPWRRQGVGAALVWEGFRLAKEKEYPAVFVVGDPQYYLRFGFKEVSEFEILNDSDIPNMYVMGCELVPEGLKNKQGSIQVV